MNLKDETKYRPKLFEIVKGSGYDKCCLAGHEDAIVRTVIIGWVIVQLVDITICALWVGVVLSVTGNPVTIILDVDLTTRLSITVACIGKIWDDIFLVVDMHQIRVGQIDVVRKSLVADL